MRDFVVDFEYIAGWFVWYFVDAILFIAEDFLDLYFVFASLFEEYVSLFREHLFLV